MESKKINKSQDIGIMDCPRLTIIRKVGWNQENGGLAGWYLLL